MGRKKKRACAKREGTGWGEEINLKERVRTDDGCMGGCGKHHGGMVVAVKSWHEQKWRGLVGRTGEEHDRIGSGVGFIRVRI